ncbi:hypothetical protein MMC20_000448 [Loxospora ochrophaea]|nr:hypothetical protein [Loxospora ochrophaea]
MASVYNNTQTQTMSSEAQPPLSGAQTYSPVHSPSATPTTVSPTSPRNPPPPQELLLATRQLRPPKCPMYVPAVLRPTERPPRPSPLTPPRSLHSSMDSLEGADGARPPPSRGSTRDKATHDYVGTIPDDNDSLLYQDMDKVTGLPTREHWKPDINAPICDDPLCQKSFSLFERRHHCRHCGHIFCNTHSHYTIPLNQDAEFHPNGTESRACKHCWTQYRQWRASGGLRKNSTGSDIPTLPGTPVIGVGRGRGFGSEPSKSSVATSVPRDWNWSTF